MTSYAHLTILETIIMTIIVGGSNLAGLPVLMSIFKSKRCNFMATISTMSMLCSIIYHLCEIYQFVPFLDQLQWHRLDNIFSIAAMELMILHLCGVLHSKSHLLQYSTLISSIIVQQKDPWNFIYTLIPPIIYLVIGILIRYSNRNQYKVHYSRNKLGLSFIFLLIGVSFLLDGLDDKNDYLRFSHGLWHVFVSIFSWFAFNSVEVKSFYNQNGKNRKFQIDIQISQNQKSKANNLI